MAGKHLTPGDIEELETMVKQALSIACLMNADPNGEEHSISASGAMLHPLIRARDILQGTTPEVHHD